MNNELDQETNFLNLYKTLNKLSATQIELLLIYSYYYEYLKKPSRNSQIKQYAKKRQEYTELVRPFTDAAKNVIVELYKNYCHKISDIYGAVYDYAHKQTYYKNLLMLI